MTLCQQLDRSLRDVFAPVDTRQVWQWAEDEIVLSRRQTETPGPYSTLLTPYVREPLACFSDPRVSDVTMCFGTQTAKSTILLIGMAWRMVNNPNPTLWVAPNENFVRSFSENRWQPMVDDCRKLAALKPENHNRYKTLEQQFRDCTVNFVGSNSPANLASRPIGLLIMDETDKFAEPSSKEAGAVALAENRTKSFTNALRVKTSTPTTREGEIWQAFLAGDQRYYYVPCPHCQHMQRLVWPRVKWADDAKLEDGKTWNIERVKETAAYHCESCEQPINSGHKTKMLREGEWRATNPNAPAGRRSYHLNSLYAPWRSCNFGELAAQFITSKVGLLGLQDFINGALAEPWEEQMAEDERPINFGEYRLREPLADGEVRMMGVDVQMDHYWFVCRAFAKDGSSRLVDEGRLQLWEDVEAKVAELGLDTPRQVGPARAKLVAVDYGFRAQEVYDRCMANRWIPCKGEERAHYPIKLGEEIRRAASIIRPFRKGWIHMLWSSQLTQDILEWLRSGQGPEWTVAGDVSDSYKRQINAHKKVVKRNHLTGRETAYWTRIGKRDDHLLDCESMITALADFGGVFRATQKPQAPPA
jgi:phage terminase large subunit GpA-like protein